MNLVSMGLQRAFRGLRTGDQRVLLAGAFLLAVGLWRRGAGKERRLVYRTEVAAGRTLVIRTRRGSGPPLEIDAG